MKLVINDEELRMAWRYDNPSSPLVTTCILFREREEIDRIVVGKHILDPQSKPLAREYSMRKLIEKRYPAPSVKYKHFSNLPLGKEEGERIVPWRLLPEKTQELAVKNREIRKAFWSAFHSLKDVSEYNKLMKLQAELIAMINNHPGKEKSQLQPSSSSL